MQRSCNGCTSCCEGWLTCTIYGYNVRPGIPCKFLSKGKECSVYAFRPENPCKTFVCYWKKEVSVPEEFKPSISKNIMIYRQSVEGVFHLDLVSAGAPLKLEILNWALNQYSLEKIDSVRWWVNGEMNYVSRDNRFIELIEKQKLSELEAKTFNLIINNQNAGVTQW